MDIFDTDLALQLTYGQDILANTYTCMSEGTTKPCAKFVWKICLHFLIRVPFFKIISLLPFHLCYCIDCSLFFVIKLSRVLRAYFVFLQQGLF